MIEILYFLNIGMTNIENILKKY